jgi:crotonobetaine/carnitine-CoA ligase
VTAEQSAQAGRRDPPWFDPAMPSREQCVLRHMLDVAAQRHPDRVLALFEDGRTWTYAEARRIARDTAAGLAKLGVRRGDRVSVWLPNGPAAVRVWFGLNYLGAVFAPINTAYRGRLLEHVLANTGARLLVAHAGLVDRLADIGLAELEQLIVVGDGAEAPPRLATLPFAALDGDGERLADDAPIEPWDIWGVIYTSGTTGPSKGVLQTYLQIWTTGRCTYGYMTADDRMLINLPMFHVSGTASLYAVVGAGASVALRDGFSTQRFWADLRETGSTTTAGLIGAMADFLAKTEPRADDADNPLRWVCMVPISASTVALARRFDFSWHSGFNMSEISAPLVTPICSQKAGGCGRPRSGVEVRIVDANDIEVPVGAVGELIVRTDLPWAITPGYLNMPEATARAWRNGWFHTGDAFRRDEGGDFYFVDRLKDTIRRRGENISSLEVEAEIASHPAVLAAAVVGVPSAHGEEEILACVALRAGAALTPEALIAFLAPRTAHFMVPRYVRMLDGLPMTETNKVRKADLRAPDVLAGAWDREAAGLVLKKQRLAGE